MTIKKDILAILVGLIISTIIFGSIYTVKLTAPDNAVVYLDTTAKIYYAPPYVENNPQGKLAVKLETLTASTLSQAKKLGFTPDQGSAENGYYKQNYRSLTSYLLEKMNFTKPLPMRWTEEGSWNW
ncbi:MAG: hypothetical protein HGA27_05995 [Peptococcaceae bacterium]|nr:hypothetical protein [Peptococcaceae bacterium]